MQPSPLSISRTLSSQTESLYLFNGNSSSSPPHQHLVITILLSVSMTLTILGTFHLRGIIQYLSFCVCFFFQLASMLFKVHRFSSMCQNFSFLKFYFYLIYLFKNFFWLCWVFVAACGLSLVVASRSYSSLRCAGFTLQSVASLVAEYGL